jgi:WhiB family redox-sensing transcriptional regulator
MNVREPWRHQAACAGQDPEYWFPIEASGYTPAHKRAVTICRSCPVQAACLNWAMENNEYYGIWGGTSARQRADLRRDRRAIARIEWIPGARGAARNSGRPA